MNVILFSEKVKTFHAVATVSRNAAISSMTATKGDGVVSVTVHGSCIDDCYEDLILL